MNTEKEVIVDVRTTMIYPLDNLVNASVDWHTWCSVISSVSSSVGRTNVQFVKGVISHAMDKYEY